MGGPKSRGTLARMANLGTHLRHKVKRRRVGNSEEVVTVSLTFSVRVRTHVKQSDIFSRAGL